MLKRLRRVNYAFDSLLGEVLLWILILLMFLWAISVVMTYHVADTIAHRPYDDLLADHVQDVARRVQVSAGRTKFRAPGQGESVLGLDSKDRVVFQVRAPDGELVAGDKDLPAADPPEPVQPDKVYFRDEELGGEEVRVATLFMPAGGEDDFVSVQVAETRNKRTGLVASIVSGVIVPQFVIVPIAVLLVYLAMSRGITPMQRLQEELQQRRPTDLTPISVKGIPAEIRPILVALNDVMVRLEENLMAQRRFIADAAHQLKTPLTGLRMQTELALHEHEVAPMRERLEQAALSAERLSHLTQQLLSLARIEAASDSSEVFRLIDLDELAPAVTRDWAERAMAKDIDLGYEANGEPMPIIGSEFLLREMLNNLLDNAIKYTPPGGHVVVRLTMVGADVRLDVEDSGVGIPVAERDKVFERFYRVLGASADGSGLGLAIVKEIAELHRARIELTAGEGGCGTRVRINIPRSSGAAA